MKKRGIIVILAVVMGVCTVGCQKEERYDDISDTKFFISSVGLGFSKEEYEDLNLSYSKQEIDNIPSQEADMYESDKTIVVNSFDYENDKKRLADSFVQLHGDKREKKKKDLERQEVVSAAKKGATGKGDSIKLFIDSERKVWRVKFAASEEAEEYEYVYVNAAGTVIGRANVKCPDDGGDESTEPK